MNSHFSDYLQAYLSFCFSEKYPKRWESRVRDVGTYIFSSQSGGGAYREEDLLYLRTTGDIETRYGLCPHQR